MPETWLDQQAVRRLCVTLAGIQLLIAAVNLLFIPSEHREYEAWKSHLESPETPAPPEPREETPNLRRETIRFVKQQLDLDRECNFTTWLSSMQGALIGFAALLLSIKTRRREWFLLMLGLFYYSMDELCQVHEWLGANLAKAGFTIVSLGPPYPWVIVLGPIFLAYGVGMLIFLNRQLREHPRLKRLATVALLLMASSLPLEWLGGELQGNAPRPPRLEVIAEETFESLGGTLLLFVLLMLIVVVPAAARRARVPAGAEAGSSGADVTA
jgi:hypothetical protein